MLYYVDDFLHIYFKPKEDTDALNMIYWLKECFGLPYLYLGSNIENVQLEYGPVVFSTKCVDYLNKTIKKVNNELVVDRTALKNYGDKHRPYSSRFRP